MLSSPTFGAKMKAIIFAFILGLNLLTAFCAFAILVDELHYPRGAWRMYQEIYGRGFLNENALRKSFPQEAQISGRQQFDAMSRRLVGPNSFDLLTHSACVVMFAVNTFLLLLWHPSRKTAEPAHAAEPSQSSGR